MRILLRYFVKILRILLRRMIMSTTIASSGGTVSAVSTAEARPNIYLNTRIYLHALARVGDPLRGTLLAERPEQISLLAQSIIEQVTAKGGRCYIKNFWDDPKPLSLGYVGVHMKIWMPIATNNQSILMELQLHFKEITDGTEDCAKEIAHRLYKMPREANEEKTSSDLISSSQLVYLTAMKKVIAPEKDLKRLENTLTLIKTMNKADRKRYVIMATALLLHNDENLGFGDWNEKLEVVVPRDREAVTTAWMKTAKEISALIHLPQIKMDPRDLGTNTATSADELLANGAEAAPILVELCEKAIEGKKGCSYTFGENRKYMLKDLESLNKKLAMDCAELVERKIRFITNLLSKTRQSFYDTALPCRLIHDKKFQRDPASLKSLQLWDGKEITDNDLAGFEIFTELEGLDLTGCNKITDQALENLSKQGRLKRLILSKCNEITDRGLEHLANLPELEELSLSDCNKITDRGLYFLGRLLELKSLRLEGCHEITDRGLESIGALLKLRHLFLTNWRITDNGLGHLRSLSSLECLWVLGLGIENTDKGLAHLKHLSSLKILHLHNFTLTDKGLESLESLSSLQHLGLDGNTHMTGSGFASLGRLPALRSLDLSHFDNVTENNWGLLGHLALDTLNLNHCELSDAHLHCLTTSRALRIGHCKQITDDGLQSLKNMVGSVSIRACDKITCNGLVSLKKNGKISSFTVFQWPGMTDHEKETLRHHGVWILS
jgi:hypothetical protein